MRILKLSLISTYLSQYKFKRMRFCLRVIYRKMLGLFPGETLSIRRLRSHPQIKTTWPSMLHQDLRRRQ